MSAGIEEKLRNDLQETIKKIVELRKSDIGKHYSQFVIIDKGHPALQDSYMEFTNEEIFINLYNHMNIQFGKDKTNEWFERMKQEICA